MNPAIGENVLNEAKFPNANWRRERDEWTSGYLIDMIAEIVSAASWSVMEIGREKEIFQRRCARKQWIPTWKRLQPADVIWAKFYL